MVASRNRGVRVAAVVDVAVRADAVHVGRERRGERGPIVCGQRVEVSLHDVVRERLVEHAAVAGRQRHVGDERRALRHSSCARSSERHGPTSRDRAGPRRRRAASRGRRGTARPRAPARRRRDRAAPCGRVPGRARSSGRRSPRRSSSVAELGRLLYLQRLAPPQVAGAPFGGRRAGHRPPAEVVTARREQQRFARVGAQARDPLGDELGVQDLLRARAPAHPDRRGVLGIGGVDLGEGALQAVGHRRGRAQARCLSNQASARAHASFASSAR